MDELRALLARHCEREMTETAIPRVILSRAAAPTELTGAIYHPLLCVIVQGRKRVFLGGEEFHYHPGSYLIASIDLPVTGQVIEAPYLGFTLALDPGTLAALLLDLPPAPRPPACPAAAAPLRTSWPAWSTPDIRVCAVNGTSSARSRGRWR